MEISADNFTKLEKISTILELALVKSDLIQQSVSEILTNGTSDEGLRPYLIGLDYLYSVVDGMSVELSEICKDIDSSCEI